MNLKKAVSIGSNLVSFFTYSVAVTIVKNDADEGEVYVDVHGKFSDELEPFFEHIKRHKLFWGLGENGLIQIYDNKEKATKK